jgi:serine/threonine-protein kinase
MLLRTRLLGLGKLLVIVGALAATYVVFAVIGMRAAVRAREVPVPNIVGAPVDQAAQTLAAVDLALRIDPNRRADEKVPAGQIVQQDPPAGVPTRRQRTIRAWVSAGPATTTVPALVGHTERTALMRLGEEGLQIASVSEFRSPDYPADAVVAQDPAPSALAPQVSLLLNRAEQATTYVMPDLIGTSGDRAAETLRTYGFRVAIVGSQPYAGVPSGTVLRQQPAGGFQVSPSDPISLEVSR